MIKYTRTYFGFGAAHEGDIVDGKLVGRYNEAHIYKRCKDCRELYWTSVKHQRSRCEECRSKFMSLRKHEKASNWKGGKCNNVQGYVRLTIPESDRWYKYTDKLHPGQILEHRYKMMNILNRPLKSNEHVHHINGIKNDNSDDNLDLMNHNNHSSITQIQKKIYRYEKRLKQLKLELNEKTDNYIIKK